MGGRMSRPSGGGGAGAAKSEETEPLLQGDASPPRRRPGYWPSADDLRVFAIIVVEMSLSIGLNFYNSYLLKHVPGFNFPLIYTAVHMLTSFVGASVLISCFGAATVGWSELRAHLPQVVLLALLRGASITTNNWSLQYIDLTLNKVIKASAPVFTVLLSVLVERKRYSWLKLTALGALAAGTALSCVSFDASRARDVRGTLLALTSAVVGGASLVVAALLLGNGKAGMNAVALLFYFSPIQVWDVGCSGMFRRLFGRRCRALGWRRGR